MAYKVVVIGGGPGGYVAAIRAAQLGASVAVIERDQLGGTCLNRGCIPTKTLLTSAELFHGIKKSGDYGIRVENPVPEFDRMIERKNQVVQKLVAGINFLFKKNKIQLFQGSGRIISANCVEVAKEDGSVEEITAENIIIATGSEPALITSLDYDGERVITSNEALGHKEIPDNLVVIGGGVVGCEFACIFAQLGSKVTIIDVMPTILPGADKEVSRQMQSLFKRRGIIVKTGANILKVAKSDNEISVVLEGGEAISTDKILISVGRTLNSKSLGLETVGIELGAKGEIIVNSRLQTNIPNIYAIGDITNKMLLAHVASAQGITAVENIMGIRKDMNYDVVPSCIFTYPETAGVGLTSQQAEEQGIAVKTGKFPFIALGKAQASGETDGFIKILADEATDRILGVHIIGPHATDLIAEAALAIKLGATTTQLAETIHAHPTFAEGMMEAAEAVHGRSIHT